jgi:hypothetical protein
VNLRLFAFCASTVMALSTSASASDSPWVEDDEPEKPAAPAAPSANAPLTPVEAAMKPRDPGLDVQLEAGAALQHIFDIPIYGGSFGMGFGQKGETSAWRLTLGGFVGETDLGFTIDEFHFGLTTEARPEPWLRFGADFHLLYVYESSTSRSSWPSGWALGPGVKPYIAFDFSPGGTASPFLSLGFEATLLGGSESFYALWGPSVDLGVHF